jgi:outer membrane lipoprotein-sorting protein
MTRRAAAVWLALTLGAFGHVEVAAACDGTAQCLREVEAAQRRLRSISARFVQTKHLALLEEPIESSGTFAFLPPDRALWRVDDPPFEVRIDGKEIRVPPGVEGAVRSAPPALTSMLGSMSAIFAGDVDEVAGRFDIEAAATADGIAVHMKPRAAGERRMIGGMRLLFAGADLLIREVELHEALGDRLHIVFLDARRNEPATESLFAPR